MNKRPFGRGNVILICVEDNINVVSCNCSLLLGFNFSQWFVDIIVT